MIHHMGGKYHHGDLRDELVRVSVELIAELGMDGFSVSQVAKRANVSPAAPYRHFPDRAALLAAVACTTACGLREQAEAAVAEAGPDPVAQLAAASGAYTAFLINRRIGFQAVFAEGLEDPKYTELHEHRRALIDTYLRLCLAVCPYPPAALELMEQLNAQAHGYGEFFLNGVYRRMNYTAAQVTAKSTTSARIVIDAHVDGQGPAQP
ncbi:TetR/AcrR family transcriptional regulator [Amycolatopsis sp. PS_44_ISF1]|uniref:TetR/AcrR family transcriptional regulator n=1 Tax=Amycolatopsis sp. PS_44_ISF1 TaxID=2974917 RepID=UPI0028E031BA|nr:TetR/AcrR family transcriptional regulator [Amycolatopsis sp. PS_44_ISF1]MDT8909942.1 TetR/AcrR family transcriptional regulator [Amycolatopsis sp. PS_44_ISF1]